MHTYQRNGEGERYTLRERERELERAKIEKDIYILRCIYKERQCERQCERECERDI